MRIAVLGTGNVGTTLSEAFVAAGHDVVIGSRQPNRIADAAAPVTDHSDAVRQSEVVVNALPGAVAVAALTSLGGDLSGKVLLDVSNALTDSFELAYPNSSVAAHLQSSLPDTLVVKSLNTFNTSVMTSPGLLGAPSTVFLSGDDADAKATVAGLLVDLGWPTESHVDLGAIDTARGPEHYFFLFSAIVTRLGSAQFNIGLVLPGQK